VAITVHILVKMVIVWRPAAVLYQAGQQEVAEHPTQQVLLVA
jgi:hypothetical protein